MYRVKGNGVDRIYIDRAIYRLISVAAKGEVEAIITILA